MIEYDVRTYLLTQSGVTSIVGSGSGSRLYVAHLPTTGEPGPKLPALVIELISDAPEYDMAGEAGVSTARLQVHALAAKDQPQDDGYHAARALGEAVRTALSGYRGAAGSSTIQSAFLGIQRPVAQDAVGIYQVTQDWEIGYA